MADSRLDALEACFDHLSRDFRDGRREFYGRLHEKGCQLLHSDAHSGFWYVPTYAGALAVQRAPQIYSNQRFTIPERPVPALIPATLDPPEHSAYRRLLARFFTSAEAARLEPRLREIAAELVRKGVNAGGFELVGEVMFPLMAHLTMVEILGLEAAKAEAYALPVHHLTQRDYPADRAHAELEWLKGQLARDIAAGKVAGSSILGQLADAELEDRQLSEDERVRIAINLLIGGMGTTSFFMGSVVVYLGRNPGQRRMLAADPQLIGSAIEELLRVFTPTQSFGRSVTRDVMLSGREIRAGEKVLIGYGCANFDPRIFDAPERVDFTRSPNRHMSFGMGPHRCLGAHIARSAAAVVTAELLRQAPEFELIEDEIVEQHEQASMFGFNRVPLRVRSGQATAAVA